LALAMSALAVAHQDQPTPVAALPAAQEPSAPPPPPPGVARSWLTALQRTAELLADPARPLAAHLDDLAERHGERTAILDATGELSFEGLARLSRRYARWAATQRLAPGDVVALLAPNSAVYFAAWTGVSRTGASVALLNTNLSGPALAHGVAAAGATHLLLAPACEAAWSQARAHLDAPPTVWPLAIADTFSADPLSDDETGRDARLNDRALLIYTSGTTGLPKAANVSHARVLSWCGWFAGLMGVTEQDRLYDCLPMYHSVGGVVAVGGALINGGSVVVRERFSVRHFWTDVAATRCTLVQYIGELCRYLLAAPPHPDERAHSLRLACGNGLREEVWTAFQARFAIPRVLEFYAATEGSFSLYNVEGRPGAVGRIPPFLAHRFPAAVVRYDPEAGRPLRDAEGRCVRCAPGEPGEAIGRLDAHHRFEGYTDAGASDAKVLRDVFEPGDAWFRTGDLMRRDGAGFFYFVDRIGDTFRWKGENVSTAEVADALAACPGVTAAAVYGVALPACDGRAGMAALEIADGFCLDTLSAHVDRRLPAYARPVLLRVRRELAATSTFKLQTRELAEDGYDPSTVADPLYLLDAGVYRAFDASMHGDLTAGRIRV
jgi:fatty-acyl-CoA synthase